MIEIESVGYQRIIASYMVFASLTVSPCISINIQERLPRRFESPYALVL